LGRVAEHEEAVQKSRARKEREPAEWINAPAELFHKLKEVHDWEIAHHEGEGQAYRRRAAIADRGNRTNGWTHGTNASMAT
jgi:hypothetical protein